MILATALAALLVLPAAAQDAAAPASSEGKWDARVTAVSGDVTVIPADGGEESAAEADMPLEEGDRVVTGDDGEAELSLDGGSLVTVHARSDFKLEKTDKSGTSFSLAFGSLLAKIQKLGSQSLQVRTPTAVAAVRGTEFGVEVEGGDSHVGVFDEGRVEVSGSGGKEVLTPNQETSVRGGQAPLKAAPLKRFAARRAGMKAMLGRLQAVRRNWKAMKPAARRAARRQALERLRILRRERQQRIQQRRAERLHERRNRRVPRRQPRRAAPKRARPQPRKAR